MELFERIRYLSENKRVSLSQLARNLGIPHQTFHQWLKPGSQKNIWEHLPKILKMFPDVRKEWLYMDELPALRDGSGPAPEANPEVEALKAALAKKDAELREAYRVNSKLSAKLLLGADNDTQGTGDVAKAAGQE